jgi:hypothetical protein
VLGQLARWFYLFGSGAHCNNYYYSGVCVCATEQRYKPCWLIVALMAVLSLDVCG